MSYSIDMVSPGREVCPTCGRPSIDESPVSECPEPTYNLNAIFRAVLSPRALHVLDGKTGGETVPMLSAAHAEVCKSSRLGELLALQPANGWGTVHDARRVLGKLHAIALENPKHVWRVQ